MKEESPPPAPRATGHRIEPYDESLRAELESLYNDFIQAITERDLDGLLSLVEVTRTDEETLKTEMSSDGFVSFSKWLLTVYPTLEHATFVSLKTANRNLAGYFLAWVPSYSNEYLNLTLLKFLRDSGQWKMMFQLTEMTSAAVQVRKDEDTVAKLEEVMKTNPLLVLEYRESSDVPDEHVIEPKLSEGLALLKEELEAVYVTLYRSMEERDKEAFLASVILSQEDETILRKKFKKLSRKILDNTPDPSKAFFVKLQTMEKKQAGYYFVAPYPKNPAFKFVYLRPFLYRDGRWRMVFSLDHDLAVSLNIAKSCGNLVSRANEVIKEISLLHLDWVMTALFENIIKENSA